MKRVYRKKFCAAGWMLMVFVLWTVTVRLVDVQAIGPQGSAVGFAGINRFFHNLTGVHMSLYVCTDWLGLVPFGFVLGFGLLGLTQWIKRKHLCEVDSGILVLGGFYLIVMVVYVLFEVVAINYRPILIDGVLEVSYPSSTTMLAMCVMPTAMMHLHPRIRNRACRRGLMVMMAAFTGFMVVGRLISGVHWVTDIIGGILCSTGLVLLYDAVCDLK